MSLARLSPVLCLTLLSLLVPVSLAGEKQSATIRVLLPANATLHIDDRPTKQLGPERLFQTPPLAAGTFTYTLKATWDGGGVRPVVRMAVARVQAGKETVI